MWGFTDLEQGDVDVGDDVRQTAPLLDGQVTGQLHQTLNLNHKHAHTCTLYIQMGQA